MPTFTAFIDESGDTRPEALAGGPAAYYVVLAIVCETGQAERLAVLAQPWMSDPAAHAGVDGDARSDDQAVHALQHLLDADVQVKALAVDKREAMASGGLAHERDVAAFANGVLYQSLVTPTADIAMFVEREGRVAFRDGFRAYLDEHHIPDLFSTCTLEPVDSAGSAPMRLASLLADMVRRVYEGRASPSLMAAFGTLADASALSVDEWPPRYVPPVSTAGQPSPLDEVVLRVAMQGAAAVVADKHGRFSDESRAQLVTLNYLLFRARFGRAGYVSMSEILKHLKGQGYPELSEHHFKSEVIAKLRDRGVLLASSNRGYKIPQTYRDYLDFVDLVNGQTLPLLERLRLAQRSLHKASGGGIPSFEDPAYDKLARVLDALGD